MVSTTRQTSTSCCHSRLLRAKRETSRAATAPTLPRQTSLPPCARIHSAPPCLRPSGPSPHRPPPPLPTPIVAVVLPFRTAVSDFPDCALLDRPRLPNVEHRFSFQMLGSDFLTHGSPPDPNGARRSAPRAAAASVPRDESSSDELLGVPPDSVELVGTGPTDSTWISFASAPPKSLE